MPTIDKSGKKYPICGPEGMRCLGKIKGRKKFFNFYLFNALAYIKILLGCLIRRTNYIEIEHEENQLRLHAELR